MVSAYSALGVAVIALGMVLTPGPNMIYLASRSISQGRFAVSVNALIVLGALSASAFLTARPVAMRAQRVVSGSVLGGFAAHLLVSEAPATS